MAENYPNVNPQTDPSMPKSYDLDHLIGDNHIPDFNIGDTIHFTKGSLQELKKCIELFLINLRVAHEEPHLLKLENMTFDGRTFQELGFLEQLNIEKNNIPKLREPTHDLNSLQKWLMGNFATGFIVTCITIVNKGAINMTNSLNNDFSGWEMTITASVNFPGSLKSSEILLPFVVICNGHTLRCGPYDSNKQTIGAAKYPELYAANKTVRLGFMSTRGSATTHPHKVRAQKNEKK